MRRWLALTFLAFFLSGLLVSNASKSFAQQDESESKRKMTTRVTPNYPGIARTMNISGTVKIEAVVAPDGTVKSAAATGGHPLPSRVSPRKDKHPSQDTSEPTPLLARPSATQPTPASYRLTPSELA